jgi:hypothetical protein
MNSSKFVYNGKNILISTITDTIPAKDKYDSDLWIEDGSVVRNKTGWNQEEVNSFAEAIGSNKFYFVVYERNGNKYQKIANKHPLRWQIEVGEIFVLSWQEISLKDFLEFKAHIG